MSTLPRSRDALPNSWPTGQADMVAEATLDESLEAADPGPGAMKSAGAGKSMLRAISTLLALTPRGRPTEITRLKALAHGFIGVADEDELVSLAKAVACRNDIGVDLADRLARTSTRAAETLIRANALSDEAVAAVIEKGDAELNTLIARHHRLAPKHITMLVADGSGPVLQALLDNHHSHLSEETQALVTQKASMDAGPSIERWEAPSDLPSDPRKIAEDFAALDAPARRAVVRRLAEDAPKTASLALARKALDPTRNEADLTFLTIMESRDPARLRDTFADTLNLDAALVGKLMDEADGEAMMVLARACGLSSTAFARLIILSKLGLTGSPQDTFALVDRYKALPEATAQSIVDAMRASGQATGQGQALERAPAPEITTPHADRTARPLSSLLSDTQPGTNRPVGQQGFRRAI